MGNGDIFFISLKFQRNICNCSIEFMIYDYKPHAELICDIIFTFLHCIYTTRLNINPTLYIYVYISQTELSWRYALKELLVIKVFKA